MRLSLTCSQPTVAPSPLPQLYNEVFYDLLAPPEAPVTGGRRPVSNGAWPPPADQTGPVAATGGASGGAFPSARDAAEAADGTIAVSELPGGGIVMRGLSSHVAGSEEAALGLLFDGEVARAVGSHALNAASSRSHAVFTLTLESRSVVGGWAGGCFFVWGGGRTKGRLACRRVTVARRVRAYEVD